MDSPCEDVIKLVSLSSKHSISGKENNHHLTSHRITDGDYLKIETTLKVLRLATMKENLKRKYCRG